MRKGKWDVDLDVTECGLKVKARAILALALTRRLNVAAVYGATESIKSLRELVRDNLCNMLDLLKRWGEIGMDVQAPRMLTRKYQTWLESVRDPLSLGAIACHSDGQRIEIVRHLVYEDTLLQVFAYSCEMLRLDGQTLPSEVDSLFESDNVADFLWRDGRPKTIDACSQAIFACCLPLSTQTSSIRKALGLEVSHSIKRSHSAVTRVWKVRNQRAPNLRFQILQDKYHKACALKDLRASLDNEIRLPDILRTTECLVAASSWMNSHKGLKPSTDHCELSISMLSMEWTPDLRKLWLERYILSWNPGPRI